MRFSMKRAAAAFAVTMAISGVAALAVGTAAQAQEETTAPSKPFRLKIGGWIPANGDARQTYGYSFLSLGAGYDIRHTDKATPNVYEVYFDYFKRPKTKDGVRNEAEMFGLGLSDRIYLTPRAEKVSYYVGGGVGLYHVRTKISVGSTSAHEYKTNVGAKFLAGAELKSGFFGEAEYSFVPEPKLIGERVKLSGTQLRIGYHF